MSNAMACKALVVRLNSCRVVLIGSLCPNILPKDHHHVYSAPPPMSLLLCLQQETGRDRAQHPAPPIERPRSFAYRCELASSGSKRRFVEDEDEVLPWSRYRLRPASWGTSEDDDVAKIKMTHAMSAAGQGFMGDTQQEQGLSSRGLQVQVRGLPVQVSYNTYSPRDAD